MQIELAGLGGYGAALYCGTGCFHRRESLCGRKVSEEYTTVEWNNKEEKCTYKTVEELEEASKVVANCSYEEGTQWGKQVLISSSSRMHFLEQIPPAGTIQW